MQAVVEQNQAVSLLISLVPVVVGGAIGVLSGLVGPPIAHWLTQSAATKAKRVEKFEELIGVLYEHEHWLEVKKNIRLFGAADTNIPTPLPKAFAITTIYFPDLLNQLDELDTVARTYEIWMLEGAKRRVAGDISNLSDGMIEAYRPYRAKFLAVNRAFQKFAAEKLTL